jgi:hypothetical protein
MFTNSGSELCTERKTRRKQQHFMFHRVEVNLAWVDGANTGIPPSKGSEAGERERNDSFSHTIKIFSTNDPVISRFVMEREHR